MKITHCKLKKSIQNKLLGFYLKTYKWKIKYKHFLNKRSGELNEKGEYLYKHRNAKSVLASINRHFYYIFTYEKYPELNIEKTTNRIEVVFKELKDKLLPHSGLARKHKILFIQNFSKRRVGKNIYY